MFGPVFGSIPAVPPGIPQLIRAWPIAFGPEHQRRVLFATYPVLKRIFAGLMPPAQVERIDRHPGSLRSYAGLSAYAKKADRKTYPSQPTVRPKTSQATMRLLIHAPFVESRSRSEALSLSCMRAYAAEPGMALSTMCN